jgi:acyl-CoA thioester hydrolase
MFVNKDTVMVYDTDYQGVAHYAAYYRFFTDAIENYKKQVLGIDINAMSNELWFVVVESKAQYYKSLHINDVISVELNPVVSDSKKSITFNLKIKIDKTGETATEGYLTMVSINPKVWKSVEMPQNLIEKFKS